MIFSRLSKKSPHLATDELLQQYMNEPLYCDYYVNLSPYINDSGIHCSLFTVHIKPSDKQEFKDIISSETSSKKLHDRFTTVPFKGPVKEKLKGV